MPPPYLVTILARRNISTEEIGDIFRSLIDRLIVEFVYYPPMRRNDEKEYTYYFCGERMGKLRNSYAACENGISFVRFSTFLNF